MIKIIGILIMAFVYSNTMAGKMYKWVDEQGQTHFSQTAPLNLDQKGKVESVNLKLGKKGDLHCCLGIKSLINNMLIDTRKGRSLADLRTIYSKYGVNLTELENFVSHKAILGLNHLDIIQMGYDTCMNAKFEFCRTNEKKATNKHAESSSGSGFFVSEEGYILTNNHVAGSCKKIEIQPQGVKATLMDIDSNFDLALLKVDYVSQHNSTFRESKPILGEQVIAAGFPYKGLLSSGIKITDGIVSSLAGMNNDPRVIQITAPIQPGNSGGPLIDNYGNVVGIIVSKLSSTFMLKTFKDIPQNVNFAINSEHVKKFLQKNKIDFKQSYSNNELELTEISQLAKNFTVEINCNNN